MAKKKTRKLPKSFTATYNAEAKIIDRKISGNLSKYRENLWRPFFL